MNTLFCVHFNQLFNSNEPCQCEDDHVDVGHIIDVGSHSNMVEVDYTY